MTVEEAKQKVALGLSQYVHAGKITKFVERDCTHCTDQTRNSCLVCAKTGKMVVRIEEPVLGEDIISTVTERGVKNSTAKVKKSPTIESKHILRGVEDSQFADAARERWDEYHLLELKERIRLLTKDKIPVIIFDLAWDVWMKNPKQSFPFDLRREPEDDLSTHSGRKYDFGRPI